MIMLNSGRALCCAKYILLRVQCTPELKLACFVCYLKIINTFFRKIMNASQSLLIKKLKNGIEILAGQAVFKLWIKTVKIMF